jgi:monomeric sarcosine oxidase
MIASVNRMRIGVVGAGGVGSAAARFLASEGHAVTVFEQFQVDHDRGSSFGASRIIRKTYPDAFYTSLMVHAYPLWAEFEREAREPVLITTGGLFFGVADGSEMVAVRGALERNGVAHEVLDAASAMRRFPAFRLRDDEIAVHEPDAGLLRASASVRAAMRIAVDRGAVLREGVAIRAIEPRPDALHLVDSGGAHHAFDRIVVTAGPWSQRLLGDRAPLRVSRQVYCHFEPSAEAARFDVGAFPIWIDMDSVFYGFPRDGIVPGVKVARHGFGRDADADTVDRALDDADRAPLRAYVRERLPGLSERVAFEKVCLYTNTPDTDFVVDRWPSDARVSFVAGLSGHGFKFAVLLGRIVAWMAEEKPVAWDLSRFALARFG